MNIAAKGSPVQLEELNSVLSSAGLNFTAFENTENIGLTKFDVIFDLNFDTQAGSIDSYLNLKTEALLFIGAATIQLHGLIPASLQHQVIGINALPTFLKRPILEACTLSTTIDAIKLAQLGFNQVEWIQSRIGMVSPRIVCMIINEAYFTLQEGTANKEDIDKGMKLGTAYPHGPFEWCNLIGIENVYTILKGMAEDTHDERYKICSLLKTDFLLSSN
ncbi:MAG: 3-hydroxyacyl-CoA dehydrogenase family protein [Bacteroidota bacterium]